MNNQGDKSLGKGNFFVLWFGAAISIAEILTGGLLAPLGFKKGLLAIIVGHLIGVSILALVGAIGAEKRLPAITSTQISFGKYGTHVFSVLNILQLLGWTSVMIISGARSVNEISKIIWSFDNITLWCIVIGALICLWLFVGKDGFMKLNFVAVGLLFVLTLVLSKVIFQDAALLAGVGTQEISLGTAIELNVIMPLSWLPLISDYTRFARKKQDAVWGSFLGYFLGSCWMYTIGLGAAIVAGNPDPGTMMLAANLGMFALGIVVLSTVTTTFLDAYSAGVTCLNIIPGTTEKKAALIMAVIGTIAAMSVPIEQFENFLYAIGSVFAPLFAILIVDCFVVKKEFDENLLINWGSAIIWAIGVILYYQFLNFDLPLGATVPVMLVTGVLYLVSRRYIAQWKYSRNAQKA